MSGLENISTGEAIALAVGISAGVTALYLGTSVGIHKYLERKYIKKELEKKYDLDEDLEIPAFIRRRDQ